jgi:hypothetical protein
MIDELRANQGMAKIYETLEHEPRQQKIGVLYVIRTFIVTSVESSSLSCGLNFVVIVALSLCLCVSWIFVMSAGACRHVYKFHF